MKRKGKWFIWSDKHHCVLTNDDSVMEFSSKENTQKALDSMPEEIREDGRPHQADLIFFDELNPNIENYDGYIYNPETDSYEREDENDVG